jgi:hypothetical protein
LPGPIEDSISAPPGVVLQWHERCAAAAGNAIRPGDKPAQAEYFAAMSSRTKGNIAFIVGALAAFYVVLSALGIVAFLFFLKRGMKFSSGLWVYNIAAVAIGTPIAVLAFRFRRSIHRIEAGQCLRCGYDVRESSERCSECGMTLVPSFMRTGSES